ncbi:hypothetical protein JCM39194_22150 [Desulfotomaculum varum]
MINKAISKKLSVLLTLVMLLGLLLPAVPAGAATSVTKIVDVQFGNLGEVTIVTDKAVSLADLNKYVKLGGKKAEWAEVDENTYEAAFAGLKNNVTYTLTESSSKLAFDTKQVPTSKRKMKWAQSKDVVVTANKTTVTVEAGKTELVTLTAKKGNEVVTGVAYTVTSSDAAVATAAVEGNLVTVTALKAGSATLTVKGSKAGETVKDATVAVDVKEPAGLQVNSVKATDANTVIVAFNKEAASVLPANFVVTQKDNGSRFYVQSAVLAADKKSATLTLFDAMAEGKAYVVATSGIKDAAGNTMLADSDELTYVKAVPASIAFTTSKLPVGNVNLNDYVVVKDAQGNVLTSGFTVTFTSNETIQSGAINTAGKTAVIVNASIAVGTATITTGNVVLAVEAAAPATVETFSLVGNSNPPVPVATYFLNGKGLDAQGNPLDNIKLQATFKDQYGKDIAGSPVYESLTPTVLLVAANGTITPIQTGTAYVRVTNGNVSKTIPVEVKANPVATALVCDSAISVVGSSTAPAGSLKVTVKDQYGNKVTDNQTINIANSDSSVVDVNASVSTSNGEATINVQGLKAGTAKLTLTLGTITKEVSVVAVQAGTVAGYLVEAADDTIDLNTSANNLDATIKVYQVDVAGNKIADLSTDNSINYELPQSALIKVDTTKNKFVNGDSNNQTGTTVVTVKAGTLVIGTVTIKTIDTTDSIAAAELVSPIVKLNTSQLVTDFNLAKLVENIKMTTKAGKVENNSDKKQAAVAAVYSSNAEVVKVQNGKDVEALPVVEGKQTATVVVTFVNTNIAPIAFNVEVSEE